MQVMWWCDGNDAVLTITRSRGCR